MNHYIVLYRIESTMCPADDPFGFKCCADDGDHAEEQCLNAYPDADIVWVSDRKAMEDALQDYYATTED
jgi:hypothetical protein